VGQLMDDRIGQPNRYPASEVDRTGSLKNTSVLKRRRRPERSVEPMPLERRGGPQGARKVKVPFNGTRPKTGNPPRVRCKTVAVAPGQERTRRGSRTSSVRS